MVKYELVNAHVGYILLAAAFFAGLWNLLLINMANTSNSVITPAMLLGDEMLNAGIFSAALLFFAAIIVLYERALDKIQKSNKKYRNHTV